MVKPRALSSITVRHWNTAYVCSIAARSSYGSDGDGMCLEVRDRERVVGVVDHRDDRGVLALREIDPHRVPALLRPAR
jgi:hypothetical protein